MLNNRARWRTMTKAEGRRRKAEGRRQKAEGGRRKADAEGRRRKAEGTCRPFRRSSAVEDSESIKRSGLASMSYEQCRTKDFASAAEKNTSVIPMSPLRFSESLTVRYTIGAASCFGYP